MYFNMKGDLTQNLQHKIQHLVVTVLLKKMDLMRLNILGIKCPSLLPHSRKGGRRVVHNSSIHIVYNESDSKMPIVFYVSDCFDR